MKLDWKGYRELQKFLDTSRTQIKKSIPEAPRCPNCRISRMDRWHDNTGIYFKCPNCKNEEPKRPIIK